MDIKPYYPMYDLKENAYSTRVDRGIDDKVTSTQTARIGKYYNSENQKELKQFFDQLKTNPK